MIAVLVGLFGLAGALGRFGVDSWFVAHPPTRRHWPWATLVVNAVGCIVIGLAAGLARADWFGDTWHTALATGFAGGLTTFSSWTSATVRLLEERRYLGAAGNVVANLALGLALAAGGLAVGAALA